MALAPGGQYLYYPNVWCLMIDVMQIRCLFVDKRCNEQADERLSL